MYERNASGEIITVKYSGPWLVVDNGYFNWSVTVPPITKTVYYNETRWSEWMESMRKDVECTFGIMKGRFCILKSGIRLHGVDIADNIWMTCCALHNHLLEIDGLSSEWQGELGLFDFDDNMDEVPFSIKRLNNPANRRRYDSSGLDHTLSVDDCEDEEPIIENQDFSSTDISYTSTNQVHNLGLSLFRNKLIEHFDILFKENKIMWPRNVKV